MAFPWHTAVRYSHARSKWKGWCYFSILVLSLQNSTKNRLRDQFSFFSRKIIDEGKIHSNLQKGISQHSRGCYLKKVFWVKASEPCVLFMQITMAVANKLSSLVKNVFLVYILEASLLAWLTQYYCYLYLILL